MGTQRPLLLDLFCGAGGAAMGYHRAGFDVLGVDVKHQPNYPFRHYVYDALTFAKSWHSWYRDKLGSRVAVVHASPPCQAALNGLKAANLALGRSYDHEDLLATTRETLIRLGVSYVIEQPEQGAQMVNPMRLCGSSFDLPIRRHRLFESNVPLVGKRCAHGWQNVKRYWTGWVKNGERQLSTVVQVYGNGANRHEWGPALGIDWMTPDELTQAIPPSYTHHIGTQLLAHLSAQAVA